MYGIKWIVLGIFLILYGLSLLGVGVGVLLTVAAICAIISGIWFIINR